MHAHEFAGLVGKYVRMERPADEVESLEYKTPTVGFEGKIAYVADTEPKVGGWGVDIVTDYGMGVTVVQDDLPEWTIMIWEDEKSCRESRV